MNGKSTLLGRRVSALAVSVAYSMLVEIAAKVGGDIESVLHRAGREEGAALREELGLTLEPRDAVNFVWARLLGSRPEIEEREGEVVVRDREGPICEGVRATFHYGSFIAGLLGGILGEGYEVREVACRAMGEEECVYVVRRVA